MNIPILLGALSVLCIGYVLKCRMDKLVFSEVD
jgi:hypothetical protein